MFKARYETPLEPSQVVADFAWQAARDGEIKMLTTGDEFRQFKRIDDVGRRFRAALGQNVLCVYDMGSFEQVPVRRVADIIASLSGAKVIRGEGIGSTSIAPVRGKVLGQNAEINFGDRRARVVSRYRESTVVSAGTP